MYPLDQRHIDDIEAEFKFYFEECMNISSDYVELARVQKSKFDLDFSEEPRVASFLKICEIFCDNRLVE